MYTRNSFVNNIKITLYIPRSDNSDNLVSNIKQELETVYPILSKNYIKDTNSYINYLTNLTVYVFQSPSIENFEFIGLTGKIRDIHFILTYNLLNEIYNYFSNNIPLTINQYNSKIKVYKAIDNLTYCPLSVDNIRKNTLIAETQCGHKFKNCILKKYLTKFSKNSLCPTCRSIICNHNNLSSENESKVITLI